MSFKLVDRVNDSVSPLSDMKPGEVGILVAPESVSNGHLILLCPIHGGIAIDLQQHSNWIKNITSDKYMYCPIPPGTRLVLEVVDLKE